VASIGPNPVTFIDAAKNAPAGNSSPLTKPDFGKKFLEKDFGPECFLKKLGFSTGSLYLLCFPIIENVSICFLYIESGCIISTSNH
jgi:hypothetical protein